MHFNDFYISINAKYIYIYIYILGIAWLMCVFKPLHIIYQKNKSIFYLVRQTKLRLKNITVIITKQINRLHKLRNTLSRWEFNMRIKQES